MESERERLLGEIAEITEQYRQEVPSGRRAWPESIRKRVGGLWRLGMRSAEISRLTGLPYYTLLEWRRVGAKFVELPVVVAKRKESSLLIESEKVGTVTVPTLGTASVILPNGVRIDGLAVEALTAMLSALGALR